MKGAMTMDYSLSGAHLLRHLHNAAMPLEGRLRMLHAFYIRAGTREELDQRAALVAATTVPRTERTMAYEWHRRRIDGSGA